MMSDEKKLSINLIGGLHTIVTCVRCDVHDFVRFMSKPTLSVWNSSTYHEALRLTIIAVLTTLFTVTTVLAFTFVFDRDSIGNDVMFSGMYNQFGGAAGLLFVNGLVGPVFEEFIFRNALVPFCASRILISSSLLFFFGYFGNPVAIPLYIFVFIGFTAQDLSNRIRIRMMRFWEKHFPGIFILITLWFVVGHYSTAMLRDFDWLDAGIIALGFFHRLMVSMLAGYLRVKTGTMWAPIVVHSAPNMVLAGLFLLLRG